MAVEGPSPERGEGRIKFMSSPLFGAFQISFLMTVKRFQEKKGRKKEYELMRSRMMQRLFRSSIEDPHR